MKSNQPKEPKRPVGAERPFPWRCRHCGKNEVSMQTTRFDAEVRHDGRVYAFPITHLEIPVCQACGEKVFTERVDAQINAALRSHLRLLTPEKMRAELERIGMNQKQAADSLGIAEATLSRWLNETQIQTRAMDSLLRVFFEFPEVRAMLQRVAQGLDPDSDPDAQEAGNRIGQHFPHVKNPGEAIKRARAYQFAPGVN
jgi:transcriptional regulator with XRE-family HTH domain